MLLQLQQQQQRTAAASGHKWEITDFPILFFVIFLLISLSKTCISKFEMSI
jgi:hypothetical protein